MIVHVYTHLTVESSLYYHILPSHPQNTAYGSIIIEISKCQAFCFSGLLNFSLNGFLLIQTDLIIQGSSPHRPCIFPSFLIQVTIFYGNVFFMITNPYLKLLILLYLRKNYRSTQTWPENWSPRNPAQIKALLLACKMMLG